MSFKVSKAVVSVQAEHLGRLLVHRYVVKLFKEYLSVDNVNRFTCLCGILCAVCRKWRWPRAAGSYSVSFCCFFFYDTLRVKKSTNLNLFLISMFVVIFAFKHNFRSICFSSSQSSKNTIILYLFTLHKIVNKTFLFQRTATGRSQFVYEHSLIVNAEWYADCAGCRFTGSVKLKGVIVIGGEEETHPSVMKLYAVTNIIRRHHCHSHPKLTERLSLFHRSVGFGKT